MNILVNAIHAIKDKGQIIISTQLEGKNVLLKIKDSGEGISKERLSKIFDPFYTTKEIGKGTGLGLSIVYDIVKQHNGNIRVNSEPGAGSEFLIRLPLN